MSDKPLLTTTIDVVGLDDTQMAMTDLGKAVTDIGPMAAKVDDALKVIAEGMTRFTASIDQDIERQAKAKKSAEDAKEKRQESKDRQAQVAEESRLKAAMSKMVNGGVNLISYGQQLDKLKQQQEFVRDAEARRIISHREASAAVMKLKVEYAKLSAEAATYSIFGGGAIGKMAAGITNKLVNAPGQAAGAAKNQLTGVGTGVANLAMGMGGGVLGGGLFGLLMHGQMNADRIKAETGEIVNIAMAAGGTLTGAGKSWLGGFQQTAEHYYGINRQEFQGVVKTFVDGGFTINDILKKQSSVLGEIGTNITTLTLGIDKHFELASGTSAKAVVSLVTDFGMGLNTAGSLYTKLAFAGSRSGMGVSNFTNSVMQASNSLRMYGVSVESVAVTLTKLQERYEALGMPKQLAGTQASMSMSQISSGMANLSSGWQSYFGEKMGMGSGLEGRQGFREGMGRISKGGDDNFLGDYVKHAYSMAMDASGGNKTEARYVLEQTGVGGGFEGAKGIIEIGDKLASGTKLNELSLKEQQNLKDAFKTEGQKTSDLAKATHTILQGLAQVGEGTLQILTNLVAVSIVFYKTLPTMIFGDQKERDAIMNQYGKFFGGVEAGFDKVMKGGSRGLKGVENLMGAAMLDPLIQAVRWNPAAGKQEEDNMKWQMSNAKKKAAQDIASGIAPMGQAALDTGSRMQTSSDSSTRALGAVVEGGAQLFNGIIRGGVGVLDSASGGRLLKAGTEAHMAQSYHDNDTAPTNAPARMQSMPGTRGTGDRAVLLDVNIAVRNGQTTRQEPKYR